MAEGVSLVVATGVHGNSLPEESLNKALEANTRDLLRTVGTIPSIERRILITNSQNLINTYAAKESGVVLEKSTDNFHFGRALFEIIDSYDIKNLLYLGGGSGALLKKGDFKNIVSFIIKSENSLVANNFYSTDMIGLSTAQKITGLSPPKKDNKLGWLGRDAGLEPHEMTRNARTQLDIDTPVDLLSLKLTERTTGRLKKHLSDEKWKNTQIRDILHQFSDNNSRLVIAGRIGGSTWSHLEKNAACQIDVISEGRGSYGNSEGSRRSFWLGRLLEERGEKSFFEFIAKKGTGLFLDTRVLFNYMGDWPSRRDRFYSDLLCPEEISLNNLRDLTEAALEHPEPVVLGGHSMVSGALYLLSDLTWQLTESTSINVAPKPFRLEN